MKCEDCRHTPNTQDCIEAFDCDCAPSSCMVDSIVGQSHDFCECGTRHDFDVPPGTEKTYACECGRLMCHRTVPNATHDGRRIRRTVDGIVGNSGGEE